MITAPAPGMAEEALAHAKYSVGDEVQFSWPTASGWEKHTGEVVAVRKHPRPKMNLRTTAPLQYQLKRKKGRSVWVDDTAVSRAPKSPE